MANAGATGKAHGGSQKEPSEDWMIVLDNFLDNDEQGNQNRVQHQHFQHSHTKASSNNLPSSLSSAPVASSNPSSVPTDCTTSTTTEAALTTATTNPNLSSSSPAFSGQQQSESNAGSDFLDNLDLSEEKKAQIRSERKRNREKQRRSDVNSQFASLTELLKRVEGYDLDSDVSDDEEDKETKKRKVNPVGSVMNITPSNRVDLIARTIAVMDRLHQVNRSLRQNVKELRKTLNKVKLGSEKTANGMNQQGFMNNMMGVGMGGNTFGGGMMMMVPQQMGGNICGQTPQSQGDNQKPMMMMVPMMMPNNMMNGNFSPQFMPNMNMMNQNGFMQGQGQNPQQVHQQQGSQQMQSMAQGLHQQQGNHHTQQPQSSFSQLNNNSGGNTMDNNNNSSSATMNPTVQYLNMNSQEQVSNQQIPRPQAASMAVYNPITNAWNMPGGQMQGQQQQPQHTAQPTTSESNTGNLHGGDTGSSSYGGNLAHCA